MVSIRFDPLSKTGAPAPSIGGRPRSKETRVHICVNPKRRQRPGPHHTRAGRSFVRSLVKNLSEAPDRPTRRLPSSSRSPLRARLSRCTEAVVRALVSAEEGYPPTLPERGLSLCSCRLSRRRGQRSKRASRTCRSAPRKQLRPDRNLTRMRRLTRGRFPRDFISRERL